MSLVIFLLILAGLALYFARPDERARFVPAGRAFVQNLMAAAKHRPPQSQPFFDALRDRTPLVIITPVLALVNVTVFVQMVSGSGSLSDPATLVAWGANFGPRTTSGEWWRLITMMFVHVGPLHLAASLAGLVPAGLILERMVGRVAFLTTYLGAGIVAALISLAAAPVGINAGPSGAIFGIYGLLLASLMWAAIQRSVLTIPFVVLKRLAPAAALFILYNVITDRLDGTAQIAGFAAGCIGGLIAARRLGDSKPTPRRLSAVGAATAIFALVFAVSLPAIADVRPELARIVATESRTADEYGKEVERFKNGRATADALAVFIDRKILPELRAETERLKALEGVPPQHRALVADAQAYLRLRTESWRLRSDALHKSSLAALRRADAVEWESLQIFARVGPP